MAHTNFESVCVVDGISDSIYYSHFPTKIVRKFVAHLFIVIHPKISYMDKVSGQIFIWWLSSYYRRNPVTTLNVIFFSYYRVLGRSIFWLNLALFVSDLERTSEMTDQPTSENCVLYALDITL